MAANTANIQILRSYANAAPIQLLDGQLAFSFASFSFVSEGRFIVRILSIRFTPVSEAVGRFSKAVRSSSCFSGASALNWSI